MSQKETDRDHLDVKIAWEDLIGKNPNMIGLAATSYEDLLDQVKAWEERQKSGESTPTSESEEESSSQTYEWMLRWVVIAAQIVASIFSIAIIVTSLFFLFVTYDLESFAEVSAVLIVMLPFAGLALIYLGIYARRYNADRNVQFDLLSNILRPFDDREKLELLEEIIEIDLEDNIPNWKTYDPDWKLSWFFPEFTLSDFLTVLLVTISLISAEILIFLPVVQDDLSTNEVFTNVALGFLIIYLFFLGLVVYWKNDTFEITIVEDLSTGTTKTNVTLLALAGFVPIMILGAFIDFWLFPRFLVYFLFLGIYPFVVELVLIKMDVIYNYNKARLKLPEILLQHERYWDAKVKNLLDTDDTVELLKTLTAIYLSRSSIENAQKQPVVPNSNLGTVAIFVVIFSASVGVINWILQNSDLLLDIIGF